MKSTETFERSESEPLPAVAAQFTNKNQRRLVAWLYHLHLHANGGAIYLSCRTISRFMNISRTTARFWLLRLESLGIIERAKDAKPAFGEATRYYWRGSSRIEDASPAEHATMRKL